MASRRSEDNHDDGGDEDGGDDGGDAGDGGGDDKKTMHLTILMLLNMRSPQLCF